MKRMSRALLLAGLLSIAAVAPATAAYYHGGPTTYNPVAPGSVAGAGYVAALNFNQAVSNNGSNGFYVALSKGGTTFGVVNASGGIATWGPAGANQVNTAPMCGVPTGGVTKYLRCRQAIV